jgi:hypothetical protein
MVDGDLGELLPEVLMAMRNEIARIDRDFHPPQGLSHIAQLAARKRHFERREGQQSLRNVIAWWAGLENAQGRGESESYRRFFFKYGLDVANAQMLGAREAGELAERVIKDLASYGIDGTIDAAAYFAINGQ